MSELRPVRSPSLIDRHLNVLVGLIVLVIVGLIAKPWAWGSGTGSAIAAATDTPPPPTSSPAPTPRVGFEDLVYDPSIFGAREPSAHWDLWPAAYLVTYGFVIQLGGPSATPVPPPPSAAASPTPPPDGGPAWPDQVTIPAGYHLFLIGIDMPLGFSLGTARLQRRADVGQPADVELAHLTSPWPDHFAVLAITVPSDPSRLAVWTPGHYTLDLTFTFSGTGSVAGAGEVHRTIGIEIVTPPGDLTPPPS